MMFKDYINFMKYIGYKFKKFKNYIMSIKSIMKSMLYQNIPINNLFKISLLNFKMKFISYNKLMKFVNKFC